MLVVACGGDTGTTTTAGSTETTAGATDTTEGPTETTEGSTDTTAAAAGGMEELIAAAQEEGTLTTIALPHDWCGYGAVIEGFKAAYGLEVNELDPGAGSAEELEAIDANKENPGPRRPMLSTSALPSVPRRWSRADPALSGVDMGRHP